MAITSHGPVIIVFAANGSDPGARWELKKLIDELTHPESESYNQVTCSPSMKVFAGRYTLPDVGYAVGAFAIGLRNLSEHPVDRAVVGAFVLPGWKDEAISSIDSAPEEHLDWCDLSTERYRKSYRSTSVSQAAVDFAKEVRALVRARTEDADRPAGGVRNLLRRLRKLVTRK
ncbi:hypothetical protein GCM10023195_54770 [Actinoallomurus liliacearum]|uniref:Flavodoxin domain-containing protein n=1 Tax=Actinoallomurus liliacearum TaxID=1080073 RepID=A0ABP8TNJ7_9ACTN